ncbi:MAG: hypothetical protein HY544_01925 [Candidatus Diapherotrites archaeon]|uniref:Uncharacterized protein n=1 Tax=Candidatus Iainarchaeum sp. TaxID=3101447 RepID=A0A8T3YI80_9ARCH|nr:hypothetical protein [Candidatus Diapherotrites archaeon]
MAEVKINERLKTPAEEEKARVAAIQESGRREEDELDAENAKRGALPGGPGSGYWRAYHSREYGRMWDGYLGKNLGEMMVSNRGLYRQYFAGLPKAEIKKLRHIVNKARELRLALKTKKKNQKSGLGRLTTEERETAIHSLLGALGLD